MALSHRQCLPHDAGDGTITSLPPESDQIHKSEPNPLPHPVWPSEPPNSLPAPGLGNRTGAGEQAGPTVQQDKTSTQPRGAVAKASVQTVIQIGNIDKLSHLVRSSSAAPPPEAPRGGAVSKGREGEEGPVEGRARGQHEQGLVGGVEGEGSGEVAGEDGKVREGLGMAGNSAER